MSPSPSIEKACLAGSSPDALGLGKTSFAGMSSLVATVTMRAVKKTK